MGGAYRAEYCRKKFRIKYNAVMQKVGSPQTEGCKKAWDILAIQGRES